MITRKLTKISPAEPNPTPESREITKKLAEADVRDLVKDLIMPDYDPDYILEKIDKQLAAFFDDKSNAPDAIRKQLEELSANAMMLSGLETHYAIAKTVGEKYRPLVIEIARQIEKEYDCKNPSEKILAEMIAGAYGKIIQYTGVLSACTRPELLSSIKNGYWAMLSKELDRAQRQLVTALNMLRQIKSPSIEINIKAKNAFVAQNQQINAVNEQVKQDGTNDPQ